MTDDRLPRSLTTLSRAFREKRLSPVEIVGALLDRIEAVDKDLNAFITVTGERALEAASRAQEEVMAGRCRGRLHGVPLGLKDLIYTEGVRTTMGSAFFRDYVPAYSATVALKPTFGRVSKHGLFPLSWTLDHVGPLTRTVEDNAILLSALAGHDPQDPYSANEPAENFARDLGRSVRGTMVGLPRDFYFELVEDEVGERVREATGVFRSLGVEVREVGIPHLRETLKAQRYTLAADAYAIHEERLKSASEKFDEEVRERLLEGEGLKAHRYASAQQRKLKAKDEFERALREVDVLLAPTVPIAATLIDQREVNVGGYEEPVRSAVTRLTGPANLNGFPSLSVPCGFTASGLPVGMQLIGRPFDEATIYRFGHAYEKAVSPGAAITRTREAELGRDIPRT